MIKVDVVLRDARTPGNQIRMSIDEYTAFIKEQSELLGIREPQKVTAAIEGYKKGYKTVNEVLEEIDKAARRMSNVRAWFFRPTRKDIKSM